MPIFDYRCPSCDHVELNVFTFSQPDSLPECPSCGAVMEKMLGVFEPVFKGDGWETNDHRRKPNDDG